MRWCLFSLFLLLPVGVHASISISEVAWMGSDESANHEWIELHNDGDATDISGWHLTDGANLDIELTGTVPANSYVVLERTSDDTAPGAAFLIYTGALVNTGATLRLERADGSLVDQVVGGEDWQNIGGDNVTKETAQYTSGGWKTAPATPGTGLEWSEELEQKQEVEPEVTTETNPAKTAPAKRSSGRGETVKLTLPDVTLSLAVDAQKLGYVHQPISFSVDPSGIGKDLISSLEYQWNFGDGNTSLQKDTEHVFDYPGTYVVTIYAGFKRQEQVARHEITILPVQFSLTMNRAGDVQVNNESPYEIDVSGYRLRGEETFTFPAYSILLPNQTVTIPRQLLGRTGERMVALYDTEAALLSSLTPATLTTRPEPHELLAAEERSDVVSLALPVEPTIREENSFSFVPLIVPTAPAEPETELAVDEAAEAKSALPATTTQLASAGTAVPDHSSNFEYIALAAVLGLGVLGVYATPRRNKNV